MYNSGTLLKNRTSTIYFMYETYLDILPSYFRNVVSLIRLSSHQLRIETGRYGDGRIEPDLRICTFCNTCDVQDE